MHHHHHVACSQSLGFGWVWMPGASITGSIGGSWRLPAGRTRDLRGKEGGYPCRLDRQKCDICSSISIGCPCFLSMLFRNFTPRLVGDAGCLVAVARRNAPLQMSSPKCKPEALSRRPEWSKTQQVISEDKDFLIVMLEIGFLFFVGFSLFAWYLFMWVWLGTHCAPRPQTAGMWRSCVLRWNRALHGVWKKPSCSG